MERKPEDWPWVFEKSSKPSLVTSSLEAIAVLVASMLYYGSEEQEHRSSIRTVPTITNNRGNGSALNKLMSTKYPACAIIMEIASFMKKNGIRASVEWAPREGNRKADSLANGNVAGFSPDQKKDILPSQIQWFVLPQALEHRRQAEEIFKCAKESGALPVRNRKGRRRRPQDRLRAKDPW